MKKMKQLLSFVLTALLLVSLLPGTVHAEEKLQEGNLYYAINESYLNGVDVLGATEDFTGDRLVIPDTLGGKQVCGISEKAFYHHPTIQHLSVSKNVYQIGENAFTGIPNVYLHVQGAPSFTPDSDTNYYICEEAHYDYELLDEIVLHPEHFYFLRDLPCDPLALTPVEDGDWTYAVLDEGVVLLEACAGGDVTVPDTLGGKPVVWIGWDCFRSENATYTLPDTVKCIASHAFRNAKGASLTRLPSALERIGCQGLKGVTILDPAAVSPTLNSLTFFSVEETAVDHLAVSGEVRNVFHYAFRNAKIRELVFEDGVTVMQQGCFYGLAGTVITIPRDTLVNEACFEEVSDITVRGYRDSYAHQVCKKLEIPFFDLEAGTFLPIERDTVQGGVKYHIYVGDHAEVVGSTEDCPEALVIPETVEGVPVTRIREWAVTGCAIRTVELPDTVTRLDEFAFFHCPNLWYIGMSEGLREVGNNVIEQCPQLRVLYLPASVDAFGDEHGFVQLSQSTLLLVVPEGSYAASFLSERYRYVVTLQEGRSYALFDKGVVELRDGEAILCGLCEEQWSQDSYFIVPDTVGDYPVTAIDGSAVFVGRGSRLLLGANVQTVEPGALLGTELRTIFTTPALTSLSVPLFDQPGTIYGYSDTYAQTYAAGTEDRFYALDDVPFSDVTKTDWFYDAVYSCYWYGIMSGLSDEVFDPTGVTSRAMLVSILYRLAGSDSSFIYMTSPFTDTMAASWYSPAVNWAAACGVVYGTSETTFSPDDPVSREQVAAILFRFASLAGFDVNAFAPLGDFKDADQVSAWAKSAVMWAVEAGIISGTDEGRLNPQGNASRAEIASMIMRFVNWLER